MNTIPWWVFAMWAVYVIVLAFIFFGGGPKVKIAPGDNPPMESMVPTDPFVCPACEATVPTADVCNHLTKHERELAKEAMTAGGDDTYASVRRKLTRAIQAHVNHRWRGLCRCGSEKPGMR